MWHEFCSGSFSLIENVQISIISVFQCLIQNTNNKIILCLYISHFIFDYAKDAKVMWVFANVFLFSSQQLGCCYVIFPFLKRIVLFAITKVVLKRIKRIAFMVKIF